MNNRNSSNFLIGLLFGVLVGVIIWYWQKSTSAEDGALALLDRLSKLDPRPSSAVPAAVGVAPSTGDDHAADDLQQVHGIGPIFASRLNKAGVHQLGQLRALEPGELAKILNINGGRAQAILDDAQSH